jgi:DNA repair protein RecN (Recombination protein N)
MLTRLSVRNLAVVKVAEITFGAGLTVVTGETGAGKSLLVDALLLLSGARADAAVVRAGYARAELAAEFDLAALPAARAWLTDQALDEENGSCQVRRVIAARGGSRAWINGRAVSLTQVSALTAMLVEIHGQHQHHALLERPQQLAVLDAFGHCSETAVRVREIANRIRELDARERELSGGDDRAGRTELLRYELAELERWALPADELDALTARHKRLANAGKLAEGTAGLAESLAGDGELTAARTISHIRAALERLCDLDPALRAAAEPLETASIQVDEAAAYLSRYAHDVDLDPERLAEADAQLTALHDLARRHRVAVAELHSHATTLRQELDALEGAGEALAQLRDERKRWLAYYQAAASQLTDQRVAAAHKLGNAVTGLMGELGMEGGSFAIELQADGGNAPDPRGHERCEFTVSANPGSPRGPLRRVASGGELSRIGLALEVAALGADAAGTMVFDEIDAGIGGGVAETVGARLRGLGARCQVLCVTHLPQVAAQGHAHLAVTKAVDGDTTHTRVTPLTGAARKEELARMLGGIEVDREARAHAGHMLKKAGRREPGAGSG